MTAQHETNRAFYDRISHAYDLMCDAGEHKARETGQAALAVSAGETALEIGFGTGNSMVLLAEQVGPTGHVSGIDVSNGMLAVAQRKLAEKGLSGRVDLQVGDAHHLPYQDATFDAVFTSFTLELFPLEDIPGVLAEIKRVLKPGGRLGAVSMAKVRDGDKASVLEKTYIWMHQHFPHIVDCQPIDLAGFIEQSGLKISKQVNLEIWTMPVAAIVAVKS